MEFNIINETASTFGDSILPIKRQQELSAKLDDMVRTWNSKVQLIRVCNIMQEIASICDSPEELAYCIILHLNWHYKRGHVLC